MSDKKLLRKANKKNKKYEEVLVVYILSAAMIVAAIGLGLYFLFSNKGPKETKVPVTDEMQKKIDDVLDCESRSVFNGICFDDTENTDGRVVGVMIDNHMNARPHSGLANASIVYEVPVEGNFTRYLALYRVSDDVPKVGPVRSARPYFLDFVSEYGDAMYVHVGGSPEALGLIPTYNIFDVNEFSRGWYFWRDSNRYAPHNTYTSSDLWQKANEDYGDDRATTTPYDELSFAHVDACEESCITDIGFHFSSVAFKAEWTYNTSTQKYERSLAEDKHVDVGGSPVEADTIIVQHVSARVTDSVGRQAIDTIGTGKAIIFQKGNKIDGFWKKESRNERTQWFDENDDPITINPGTLWIEVLSQSMSVTTNEEE